MKVFNHNKSRQSLKQPFRYSLSFIYILTCYKYQVMLSCKYTFCIITSLILIVLVIVDFYCDIDEEKQDTNTTQHVLYTIIRKQTNTMT
jgi:hypothetical protein